MSRNILLWTCAVAVLSGGAVAWAGASSVQQADQFVAALKRGRFHENAAAFHYPPSYTSMELAADRSAVTHFLEGLIHEIGGIQGIKRVEKPSGAFLDLAIGGGDLPYWSSHPELNCVEIITYEVQTKREGQVYFALSLVQPKRKWELRNFTFEIPASRPGAAERILELGRKLYPSNAQAPT